MNKRIKAAMAAIIATGMILFGAALPAQAHHATLTHAVICDTSNYTYTVTLNVANSEHDKVMTITDSHGNPVVLNGDTVAAGATRTYQLTGVLAPVDSSITIDVSWPNGVTASASDTLLASEYPVCTAPTPTPTPTPTVTPTPTATPTPTPTVTTPPVVTPHGPELAATGPNPMVIFVMVMGGLVLIAVGIVLSTVYKARFPRHRASRRDKAEDLSTKE